MIGKQLAIVSCLAVLCTAAVRADEVPAATVIFKRLEGVNPEAGVFCTTKGTRTQYVYEERQRTVTIMVNGMPQQKVQAFTVRVPMQVAFEETIGIASHDAYDGRGKLIPVAQVFNRLKNGQLVLMATTATLPKDHLRLLSPDAVLLVPKPKADPGK